MTAMKTKSKNSTGSGGQPALKPGARAYGPDGRPVLNIAMVYQDLHTAAAGKAVFNNLVREFHSYYSFSCTALQFESLNGAGARRAAMMAREHPDLFIVSARGDQELPGGFKSWFTGCLSRKRPGSAAVVALLESNWENPGMLDQTREFLADTAIGYGMDFMARNVEQLLHDDSESDSFGRPSPGPVAFGTPEDDGELAGEFDGHLHTKHK